MKDEWAGEAFWNSANLRFTDLMSKVYPYFMESTTSVVHNVKSPFRGLTRSLVIHFWLEAATDVDFVNQRIEGVEVFGVPTQSKAQTSIYMQAVIC